MHVKCKKLGIIYFSLLLLNLNFMQKWEVFFSFSRALLKIMTLFCIFLCNICIFCLKVVRISLRYKGYFNYLILVISKFYYICNYKIQMYIESINLYIFFFNPVRLIMFISIFAITRRHSSVNFSHLTFLLLNRLAK